MNKLYLFSFYPLEVLAVHVEYSERSSPHISVYTRRSGAEVCHFYYYTWYKEKMSDSTPRLVLGANTF